MLKAELPFSRSWPPHYGPRVLVRSAARAAASIVCREYVYLPDDPTLNAAVPAETSAAAIAAIAANAVSTAAAAPYAAASPSASEGALLSAAAEAASAATGSGLSFQPDGPMPQRPLRASFHIYINRPA
jgi:hypothetical protein